MTTTAPTATPTRVAPDANGIPAELRALARWVVSGDDKVPHTPLTGRRADPADPATGDPFADALAALDGRRFTRLGLILAADAGVVGFDWDGCRNPETGAVDPDVWAEIAALDTYTELSPSGTGLRAFAYGTLPPGGRKRGKREAYGDRRYVSVTGRVVDGLDRIEERSAAIAAWHAEAFPPAASETAPLGPVPDLNLDDEQILANARRMPRFSEFWDGGGADDRSAGDLTMVNQLVAAGATDPGQLDRMMRASDRMRPKWDQRRGQQTYGERTIARALDGRVVPFEGFRPKPPVPPPGPPPGPPPSGTAAAPPPPQSLGLAPDACAQRVAQLETLLAERDATITAQAMKITRLEEQVATIQAVQSSNARILGNRDHGPARVMASTLATEIAWRSTAGAPPPREQDIDVPAGMVAVTVKELAERAGCSANTAGSHLAQLAERGLVRRLTRTVVRDFAAGDIDPETGEIYGAPITKFTAQHFVGPADATTLTPQAAVDFAKNLADFSAKRIERRGGKRIPRCPDHPTAEVVKQWVAECAECGRELDRGAEKVPPMLLDPAPPPIPKVWDSDPPVAPVYRHTKFGDDSGAAVDRARADLLARRAGQPPIPPDPVPPRPPSPAPLPGMAPAPFDRWTG